MATLKAGDVVDYEGSMAEYIDLAMQGLWAQVKGSDHGLPTSGPAALDRRILCAAIANGVLDYLRDRGPYTTSAAADDGHSHTLAFEVS